MLITFNGYGVSDHPNHKSLYHGAIAFVKALMHRHQDWECPVALYSLTSLSVWRKYVSVLDGPASLFSMLIRKKENGSTPTPLLFANGLEEYKKARHAMVKGASEPDGVV